MSMLDAAVAGLASTLKVGAGTSVAYTFVSHKGRPVTVTGVRTVNDYEVIDEMTGIPTVVKSIDWLFTAADLVLEGEQHDPHKGDKLVVGEETYEVAPVAKRPVCEPHDAAGVMIVVHTKKVS